MQARQHRREVRNLIKYIGNYTVILIMPYLYEDGVCEAWLELSEIIGEKGYSVEDEEKFQLDPELAVEVCVIFVMQLFSNLSVTSPMSQLILQPFRYFTYITAHSPTLPSLHLRHSSFSNPSFASPTSQALHLFHLASRPWGENQILLALFSPCTDRPSKHKKTAVSVNTPQFSIHHLLTDLQKVRCS